MSLITTGSVLVVFLWSVTVVLGQDGWSVTYTTQSICSLKGSTVEMSCSYTYPRGYNVTSTFWFTKYDAVGPVSLSDDPDYKGRVTYREDEENSHTLTITDLRESDSATYKFRFITDQTGGIYTADPGVTLSVTDLQVKVTPYLRTSRRKTLTCSTTSCPLTGNPIYIWYKNGQFVTEKTSLYSVVPNAVDSYFCSVKDHEGLRSPTVYKPKNTSVSVIPSGEIVEGSSVTLTCSSDANPPVQSYTWYKKNGGGYQSMTGPQHIFNQIQSSDTGEYYCEAQNEMGTDRSTSINMDVKYGPKKTSVSVSPSGEIVEGSSVTLTCSSDANPPVNKYTWYFQNKAFLHGFGQIYYISNFMSKDNGHYHCEAWNGRGSMNSTTLMITLPEKQTLGTIVLVIILCLFGFMCFSCYAERLRETVITNVMHQLTHRLSAPNQS